MKKYQIQFFGSKRQIFLLLQKAMDLTIEKNIRYCICKRAEPDDPSIWDEIEKGDL